MANEFALNLQDASLNPATWALPTQVGEANGKKSAAVDLGADTFKNARYELEIAVPALSDTIAPAAATAGVAYEIWTTTSSTLDLTVAGAELIAKRTYVGTGSGIVATVLRARAPSNSSRYACGKVWLGTTCTDASALAATLTPRF